MYLAVARFWIRLDTIKLEYRFRTFLTQRKNHALTLAVNFAEL